MTRIAVIGALILVLAMLGGPAFAQVGEGSVLPEQREAEVLPVSARPPSGKAGSVAQPTAPVLADTGMELTNGLFLGGTMLLVGGAALMVGRRRSAR